MPVNEIYLFQYALVWPGFCAMMTCLSYLSPDLKNDRTFEAVTIGFWAFAGVMSTYLIVSVGCYLSSIVLAYLFAQKYIPGRLKVG